MTMNEFFPIGLAREHARVDGRVDDLAFRFILKAAIEFTEEKTAFKIGFKQNIANELVIIDNDGEGYLKYRPVNNQALLRFHGNQSQRVIIKRNKFALNSNPQNSCGDCDSFMRDKNAWAQYEAGFDCFDNLPAQVSMAILKLVGWHYEKRGDDAIAKYTRKNTGGVSSLYDNRGYEFSGARELLRKYESVGVS
jgi:hypothetical protein